MRLECLAREGGNDPKLVLADFLRTPLARIRYGRSTIYTGETYYIPYYRIALESPRESHPFIFLASAVKDDVAVCKADSSLRRSEEEADGQFVLDVKKDPLPVRREIEKKIKMNRRLRKSFARAAFSERDMRLVYVAEPSFLVQCRTYRIFLVDPLTEKVDFRHLAPVEERFLAAAK